MKWPECYRCIIFSSFRALHVESVTAGAPPRKRCMDFWERLPSPCSSSIAEQPVNVYRVYFLVVFFFFFSFVCFFSSKADVVEPHTTVARVRDFSSRPVGVTLC